MSVFAGMVLDLVYGLAGISPQAVIGQAAEIIPGWLEVAGAVILIVLSIRPIVEIVQGWTRKHGILKQTPETADCDCSGSCS